MKKFILRNFAKFTPCQDLQLFKEKQLHHSCILVSFTYFFWSNYFEMSNINVKKDCYYK